MKNSLKLFVLFPDPTKKSWETAILDVPPIPTKYDHDFKYKSVTEPFLAILSQPKVVSCHVVSGVFCEMGTVCTFSRYMDAWFKKEVK